MYIKQEELQALEQALDLVANYPVEDEENVKYWKNTLNSLKGLYNKSLNQRLKIERKLKRKPVMDSLLKHIADTA